MLTELKLPDNTNVCLALAPTGTRLEMAQELFEHNDSPDFRPDDECVLLEFRSRQELQTFLVSELRTIHPLLKQLEGVTGSLDYFLRQKQAYLGQAEKIQDSKIYDGNISDDFDEVELVKRTAKTYFVRPEMNYGERNHCIPAEEFDREGKFWRRNGTGSFWYWQGWRVRQELLECAESQQRDYDERKQKMIPELLRQLRRAKIEIPHNLVLELKRHYS